MKDTDDTGSQDLAVILSVGDLSEGREYSLCWPIKNRDEAHSQTKMAHNFGGVSSGSCDGGFNRNIF